MKELKKHCQIVNYDLKTKNKKTNSKEYTKYNYDRKKRHVKHVPCEMKIEKKKKVKRTKEKVI